MKHLLCWIGLLISINCFAGQGQFGVGFMLGEPLALSAKYWVDDHNGFDIDGGYSFNHYYMVMADYLYHARFKDVRPYFGFGLGVAFLNDGWYWDGAYYNHHWWGYDHYSVGLFARIPLGVEFMPRHTPIGLFVEIAPGITLMPDIQAMFQGDIGFRFYF